MFGPHQISSVVLGNVLRWFLFLLSSIFPGENFLATLSPMGFPTCCFSHSGCSLVDDFWGWICEPGTSQGIWGMMVVFSFPRIFRMTRETSYWGHDHELGSRGPSHSTWGFSGERAPSLPWMPRASRLIRSGSWSPAFHCRGAHPHHEALLVDAVAPEACWARGGPVDGAGLEARSRPRPRERPAPCSWRSWRRICTLWRKRSPQSSHT